MCFCRPAMDGKSLLYTHARRQGTGGNDDNDDIQQVEEVCS